MAESTIADLLTRCEDELKIAVENGDNKRKLVKLLQELASQKHDLIPFTQKVENYIHILWNHPVLLEDCILVSGIIFTKLHQGLSYTELCDKGHSNCIKNEEWVSMSLVRGSLLDKTSPKSQDQLDQLVDTTLKAINLGLSSSRSVLISRHLENLLIIFTCENELTVYDALIRGNQVISLVNQTIRLNADLTDYKSRDLIKYHLNILNELGNREDCINFATSLLDCLPEVNKITVQICDSLCSYNFLSHSIASRILDFILPCLNIKGGLGSAAATCVGKLLGSQNNLDSCNMLPDLLDQILMYQSSRDIIKIFNLILGAVDEQVKANILEILKAKEASLINRLLIFIIQEDSNCSGFESLLVSGDEFIALEAFSLLTRDSIKRRRKPAESISNNDIRLFQKFIDDVCFSGSVEFRQKASVSAKSFYDQIFARIYNLFRELSKKPQLESKSDDNAVKKEFQVVIDYECLTLELNMLFDWLGKFVRDSLVEPFDFRYSNFGSVEFAFAQLISIFYAFDGNATLVAASPIVLSCIASRFQSSVIDFSLIPSIQNFITCVAKSTYDKLRLQAIEIICKCKVDVSAICLEKNIKDLEHPRAINNEGAARIIQLHARLSNISQIEAVLHELSDCFIMLKSDFPTSLRGNNINGRLLLLSFLIEDQHGIKDEIISKIINLSIEISTFVSEIASHPSPEGLNISSIDSFNNEEDEDGESCDEEIDDKETIVSSQYVLSFSWRAIKETSSLIETLVKKHSGSVAKARLHSISDHFISLLLSLRHCGAFRSLQKPLSTTLRLGYSFAEKAELLQHVLDVCLGTGQINTTRRSAGLPFLILAIAHSCSSHSNELENLLANIFPPLLKAASDRNESSDESEISSSLSPSVIHSFNIIRSLVRDSRISSKMGPHMASVAKLCLDSFNSVHWNVRNASAMLLSSLISRIFGPKYVNDFSANEHNVDLREIEVKFEGMIRVLTSYFIQVESKQLDPKFAYPLLAVLERVKIPPNERYEEFRSVIIEFIARLLEKLENHPENGRKLVHVLSRTVFSLLNSKSLRMDEVHEKILMSAPRSTTNGVYNLIVLLENIKSFYSGSVFVELLPPIQVNWHPILFSKYEKLMSHKSELGPNFCEQKGSPVISDEIIEELHKKLPNIRLICQFLNYENISTNAIHSIVERFRLNDEILAIALPLLCRRASENFDDRLVSLFAFYSAAERNENLRFIALDSLKQLHSDYFKLIPESIFSLIVDDDEEIRLGICKVLNASNPLCPAESLRRFIGQVGTTEFIKFLDNYQKKHSCHEDSHLKLFEKEPLNLFIDVQFLRKKLCSL